MANAKWLSTFSARAGTTSVIFDVGIDTGSPVGPYPHDYRCTADITSVTLERLSTPDDDTRARMLAGEWSAAISTQ